MAREEPDDSTQDQKPQGVRGAPALEWAAAALGLLLTLAALVLIGSEAFAGDESPPAVVVSTKSVQAVAGGYVVEIEAKNGGGQTAAGVRVEGELTPPSGQEPETAEATFDFIPDHSSREGGLFFSSDPRQGKLAIRATGYVDP